MVDEAVTPLDYFDEAKRSLLALNTQQPRVEDDASSQIAISHVNSCESLARDVARQKEIEKRQQYEI